MRRGTLFLPRRFYGAFDEGSIRATDESGGEELEVSFTPPRQLEGLGPFFEAHELKPNDAVKLRLEEGTLVLGVVLRERRTTPESARTSGVAPGNSERATGQGVQRPVAGGEALRGGAVREGEQSAGAYGAERLRREESWGARDAEQFGIVRERRIAAEEQASRDPSPKERDAQAEAAEQRERAAQESVVRERAQQERAAQERVAKEREAQEREAQERAARARAAQEREAQRRAIEQREAQQRAIEQREAEEREARQQAALDRERQELGAREADESRRAPKERTVDTELTAPPTTGWQKVLHDPAPRRTQGVPVSPEELGKVDDTTEIWKRSRSRTADAGAANPSTNVRKDEGQSRSKATEADSRSPGGNQGSLSPLDAGGPEAWHLSPRDLSSADANREKSREDDGLWVKETRRPKSAPAKPLAAEPHFESQPQSPASSPAESQQAPHRQEPAANQTGLFDGRSRSDADGGGEREKVAVSAGAGSGSNAASRVSDYLRDPSTPAIVRAPAIAEALALPLGEVQQALEDVSRSSEGSVTPIRADVYLVKRNRQEE